MGRSCRKRTRSERFSLPSCSPDANLKADLILLNTRAVDHRVMDQRLIELKEDGEPGQYKNIFQDDGVALLTCGLPDTDEVAGPQN